MRETSAPAVRNLHAAMARPFALLLVIAVASVAAPFDSTRLREVSVAIGAVTVMACLQVYVMTGRRAPWLTVVPALGCFVVVALLRDASGGSSSGVSALAGAPAFYLAMVGGRRELKAAVVCVGLLFLVPLVLIGGPEYTSEDARRAVIWMVLVGVLGTVVQQLVRSLSQESAEATRTRNRLQMVLDGAELSAMIVTDAHGLITTFGVGATRLLGFEAAEVTDLRRLTDLHEAAEILAAAAELGVEPGFEVFAQLARERTDSRIWTWTDKDGAEVLVRTVVTELRDAGTTAGYLCVATDITDALRAQRALLAAEERWRVVMDHLPDTTLILTDHHLDVRLVSGAGSMREKLLDAAGKPLAEVVSPANVTILGDLAARALAGSSGTADLESVRTGHEHVVNVVPLPHQDGPADVLILARDVSVERARERALELARYRAERMFADAPVAIVLHDLDGRVISANPAALRLFELSQESLVGARLTDLVAGQEDPSADEHLGRLRSSVTETAESRWQLELSDSRQRYLSVTSRRLHDDPHHPDLVLTHVVDRTEQHHHETQLLHLADHDPLTGLANRRRFDVELARHLDACRRYGAEGALLVLDLDHFKEVNDTVGHPVGDQLLIAVAQLLNEELRASDTVARIGGDEFVVLLPRVSRSDAEVVASSLVRSLSRAMQRLEGPAREVTMSVGVGMVLDSDRTAEQLVGIADQALYEAKHRGRNQYYVYHPDRATAAHGLTGVVGLVDPGSAISGELSEPVPPAVSANLSPGAYPAASA